MMSDKEFKFTVVTPDKCLFKDTPALAVGAWGSEGAFTALPGHVPFLTDLKPGVVWYRDLNGEQDSFFVGGGFVEVLPERVTILADSAEKLDEIDRDRAERAILRAKERLAAAKVSPKKPEKKVYLTPEEEAQARRDKVNIFLEEAALQRALARARAAREKNRLPHKH
ncbi:MAG: ATP synthase F1 subunit epsilon [Deltaproteobacteria bacterium]|jgi:F-type H+-transporting ATPase subunit epsilon|nr:ATP synthase F1 subunit epsilon [Deltaproteobacteria bacterium]